MRKIVCFIGAVLLLVSLSVCASAEEYTGSFRIAMNVGDLAVTNGAFTVYRVGIRISDGYRITDEFGGGFVNLEDAQSPHLAQWLAENNADSGRTLLLDADGYRDLRKTADYTIMIRADEADLRERLIERKTRGYGSREQAEIFVEKSDMKNVRLVLEKSMAADLTLRMGGDGSYHAEAGKI